MDDTELDKLKGEVKRLRVQLYALSELVHVIGSMTALVRVAPDGRQMWDVREPFRDAVARCQVAKLDIDAMNPIWRVDLPFDRDTDNAR